MLGKPAPLIRVKSKDLAAAGVRGAPRVVGVRGGKPLLEDGRTLDVANVIWCSGLHPGFDWIDLPVFGDDGGLLHCGGRDRESTPWIIDDDSPRLLSFRWRPSAAPPSVPVNLQIGNNERRLLTLAFLLVLILLSINRCSGW